MVRRQRRSKRGVPLVPACKDEIQGAVAPRCTDALGHAHPHNAAADSELSLGQQSGGADLVSARVSRGRTPI